MNRGAVSSTHGTLADAFDEAVRLVKASEAYGSGVRLVGGAAIAWRSRHIHHPALERRLQDIDMVTLRSARESTTAMLESVGYRADAEFNALHGRRRLLFMDPVRQRQIDVFVEDFVMCHEIPLGRRLDLEPATLPLAELVMTKLQIYKLNPKDRIDLYRLLLACRVGDTDGDVINAARIARVAADDWGLQHTMELNLDRLRAALTGLEVPDADRSMIGGRIETLAVRLATAPKSLRWKARARLGERVRWYEDPDDP